MALDLPDGSVCFVDANIFYYYFVDTRPFSDHVTRFFERVALDSLIAFTSIHVVAEAIHKVMAAEAAAHFSRSHIGIVNWLQKHPQKVQELYVFRDACRRICGMKLSILSPDASVLSDATECSRHFGLLTNDAITVGLMKRHGLTDLVTNDDDFRTVSGLTVWAPR
jgi:predicted nucleic acid-binding protein